MKVKLVRFYRISLLYFYYKILYFLDRYKILSLFAYSTFILVRNVPDGGESVIGFDLNTVDGYCGFTERLIDALRADPVLMKVSTEEIIYMVQCYVEFIEVNLASSSTGVATEFIKNEPPLFDFKEMAFDLRDILMSPERSKELRDFHASQVEFQRKYNKPGAVLFFETLWEEIKNFLRARGG